MSNVVAIAAADSTSFALRADGTVVAWGYDEDSQTEFANALTSVLAIAGSSHHGLALRADATVVAWGLSSFGGSNVPPDLRSVVAIAAGYSHNLALIGNGEPFLPPELPDRWAPVGGTVTFRAGGTGCCR